jgi:predicted transcriptional regulator of viral defense system
MVKMTQYDKIYKICNDNNGTVTASMVAENNIDSWYLSDMVNKGMLIRISRGIYTTEGGDFDEYFFFQTRNKRCIYSYSSALYLHGMTDRIPFHKEVTVYKGYNSSHITDGTVVHHVSKELHEFGITECRTIFGNSVIVYDKERTICDLIAHRKSIDSEIFTKAMRSYASSSDKDYKKLRTYARKMKIGKKVDEILEIL